MLLGILSACIGILFALVKYGTAVYLRTMREKITQTQNDLVKANNLFQAMDAKHKVAGNRHQNEVKKTSHTRTRVEGLYTRLSDELPTGLQLKLQRCQERFPLPDRQEAQLIDDLKLGDSISEGISDALRSLSLLIFTADGDADPLLQSCHESLEQAGGRVRRLEGRDVVAVFDAPAAAFSAFVGYISAADPASTGGARAVLCAGIDPSQEKGDLSRLSGRLLKQARQIVTDAPEGALLLNRDARDALDSTDGIADFDSVQELYAYAWTGGEDQ